MSYIREIDLFSHYNKIKKKDIKKRLKQNINSINLQSINKKNKILEFDQLTWLPMLLRKRHYRYEL